MAEQPSYFSILTAEVRYNENLKPNEKLLFSEITALSNKLGYCTASNAYFSKLYKVDRSTISRWISNLQKYGYVHVELIKENQQVKQRKIYPVATPLLTKKSIPYAQKNQYPIDEKVKGNNTSINNTSINKEHSAAKPAQLALKDEFEQLWKNYPNKKGKNAAFNHYKAWRKKSVKNTNEYLEQKLADYLKYCEFEKDWYHPMNGSTWFNGRFDDDLEINKPKNNRYNHFEGENEDTVYQDDLPF